MNLVSVIVTHRNYSHLIGGALQSLAAQTHTNWECVVVDDASAPSHRDAAAELAAKHGSAFLKLPENVGQIPAFFAGLDETKGEFVCLLDPDDRYHPEFLQRMLAAHMNATAFCPIACCDQRIARPTGEVISGIYSPLPLEMLRGTENGNWLEIPATPVDRLLYVPAHVGGWHWTSTSSMMFRRPALELMRPHKKLAYWGAADSYLAMGAHSLGGTLRLTTPLVDRTAHQGNAWLTEGVFGSMQSKKREGGVEVGTFARVDVADAIRANGGAQFLGRTKTGRLPMHKRLRRSIEKRVRRLTGLSPKHGGMPA